MHGNSLDEEEPDSPSLTYMSYPELKRTSFIIQSLNKKLGWCFKKYAEKKQVGF